MFYAEKAQRAARKAGKICRWVDWSLSAAMVGGLVFVMSPNGYAALKDWREHTVTVRIDPEKGIVDVAGQLNAADFRQISCLAKNMYWEAGREGQAGMKATGDVVFNLIRSGLYPDTICQVVYQAKRDASGHPIRNRCQFSWYCDGRKHIVTDERRWNMAYEVAYNQYLYNVLMPDLTNGATFYHANYVHPRWKKQETAKIGAHIFYRPDPSHKRKDLRP